MRVVLLTMTLLLLAAQAWAQSPSLDERHAGIRAFLVSSEVVGPGGLSVLDTAHRALAAKHASGEGTLVGLEDLWTHSLQEGQSLFERPERLWGITTAEETHDMIGQSTVGPWQMTTWNIRDNYGPRYGVGADWTDAQIHSWCAEHPEVQAMMITDYIQLSYELFGRRTPYAIQRYFWLEPYVRGELGQAEDWTKSPVARPPEGMTWEDLTPAMRADTGFYAKQILLGARYNHRGLLFWLVVSGDEEGAREVLRAWRDQPQIVVAEDASAEEAVVHEGVPYVVTDAPGDLLPAPEDLYWDDIDPAVADRVRALIVEVAAEEE